MTSWRIEPATFRLVAQCLDKLHPHDHNNNVIYKVLKFLELLQLTVELLSSIVQIVMMAKGKLCLFIFVYIILKYPIYIYMYMYMYIYI